MLFLRAGDLLAPGALAALALEAALSGVDGVAGLRVLFDGEGVHRLDMLSAARGTIGHESGDALFTDGEILLSRRALVEAGGCEGPIGGATAKLWQYLAERPERVSRIGRPVLLQRAGRLPAIGGPDRICGSPR